MGLKPGYKRTEVGVIPEEWEAQPLATLTTGVSSGKSKPMKGATTFPVFGSTGIIGHTEKPAYEGKAILVARVGANAGTLNIVTGQYGVTDNTIIVSTSESVLPDFLWRALQTKRLNSLVFGSGQPLITGTQLKALSIQLPSLDEQRAIATALSDVDALLTQLDRLIAKKRDIKQATMQQLLTGKTRLPGFGGEWQVRRLGEHVTFLRNGVHSRAELTEEGSVKYLHYGDIHTSPRVRLDPAVTAMPCLPAHKAATLDRLRTGDLVFADASEDMEGVGKSVEIGTIDDSSELVSGLHTIAARFDRNTLADGFKAYLQFCPAFRSQLYRLAAGTKVYATTRNHIASIEIALPCLAEQTAIATLLSDLDAELAALEARRDKTRALKQGMMQELLTGRTRLV